MQPPKFRSNLERNIDYGFRGWIISCDSRLLINKVLLDFDDGIYRFSINVNKQRNCLPGGNSGVYGFELRLIDMPLDFFSVPSRTLSAYELQSMRHLTGSPYRFIMSELKLPLLDAAYKDIADTLIRKFD